MTRVAIGAIALVVALSSTGCTADRSHRVESEGSSALKKKYPEQIDLAQARGKCLTEKGWPVTVRSDASISLNLKPGTEDAYDRDDATCLKELGVDPKAPPSEQVLRNAYSQSVSGADCLRESGWSVSKAPTFATFKDKYETDAWYPWAEVPVGDSELALKACPAPGPQY